MVKSTGRTACCTFIAGSHIDVSFQRLHARTHETASRTVGLSGLTKEYRLPKDYEEKILSRRRYGKKLKEEPLEVLRLINGISRSA